MNRLVTPLLVILALTSLALGLMVAAKASTIPTSQYSDTSRSIEIELGAEPASIPERPQTISFVARTQRLAECDRFTVTLPARSKSEVAVCGPDMSGVWVTVSVSGRVEEVIYNEDSCRITALPIRTGPRPAQMTIRILGGNSPQARFSLRIETTNTKD